MKANAVAPTVNCAAILPGFQFADAYAVAKPPGMDAITATRTVFAATPSWIAVLMALRDKLVGPLGLKAAPPGGFPVIRESAEEVLLGFDDSHLDFRIAVTTGADGASNPQVVVTTIVRTHNRFGRTYLALVMPFHRIIARRMAERVWA